VLRNDLEDGVAEAGTIAMDRDDDLAGFDANGLALPPGFREGFIESDGARIWYADYPAAGPAVILLSFLARISSLP
jgi:hypothetical protein